MTEKKPAQPAAGRHIVGDSIFPPFQVKAPLPSGTAAPGSKAGASQTTASGDGKAKTGK